MATPNYYFWIDSLSRIETEVPEPPAPLLLFSALLVLLLKRYRAN
ncbi:MAG: PEP-CTERM sorting domain-containing protein [Gammaproteobacteria bacterium]|nr:MAG: PEP-CTERM sorting domain-containing protein [Gammaproteobacteria bacterium]